MPISILRTFLAILLFTLQSLTTFAQTTLTPTAPGSYQADGELFASLKKIGDDFDSIQWMTQLFTATEIIDAIDKLRSEQNIRVYPLIDFDRADDEFILGLIELYFEKRTNGRPANWIDLKLKLTPLTSDLYNFRQYRLNMDLTPAPTLGISSDLVTRVNGQINTALDKIQTINGDPAGLVTAIANGLRELLESLRNLGGLKPDAELLKHLSIAYYPSATQAYSYDAPGTGLPPVAQFDSYEVNGKTIQVPAKALADVGSDPVLIHERYLCEVDMVVDAGYGHNVASTVIDCTSGEPVVIRQGIGEV